MTGRLRVTTLLAAVVVTLALVTTTSGPQPVAQAATSACVPAGVLWHFQNYTVSGKTLRLDGYTGPDGTGTIEITCELRVPKAKLSGWTSKGGEIWMPFDVQSVKITSWSDGGGDPVLAGPYDNSQNTCFRIIYNAYKTSWKLPVHSRGDKCDTA